MVEVIAAQTCAAVAGQVNHSARTPTVTTSTDDETFNWLSLDCDCSPTEPKTPSPPVHHKLRAAGQLGMTHRS